MAGTELDFEYDCTCQMCPEPHTHHITGWIDRTYKLDLSAVDHTHDMTERTDGPPHVR